MNLKASQLEDLAVIRDLGPDRLQTVIEHLRGLQPLPLRPDELHSEIATALGGEIDAAESILGPVLALLGVHLQTTASVDDIIESLERGIERTEEEWTDDQRARWSGIEPQLRELFELPAFRVVAKAIDLSYEYANLLQGARVVTDIRPIFNVDATAIDGAVISHTLRLYFSSRDGSHSLSIALDEDDIVQLEGQCQRARQKARLARDHMNNSEVRTIISGESDND